MTRKFASPLGGLAAIAVALTVAACSGPTPTSPPSDGPSAAPSASPSGAPVASPTPSAAPSNAAPSFSWTTGEVLRPYAFNRLNGVYFDRLRNQLYVVDADSATTVTPRYLFRKFAGDGTFLAEVALAPEGGTAPEQVDSVAFDLRGNPIFTHEDKDDEWRLLKLFTATVRVASGYPVNTVERAGPSALYADGAVLHAAVVSLDPDTTGNTGGQIYYGVGAEDEAPQALFSIPDPLYPSVRMTFGPDGYLYLVGPNQGGGFGFKRVGRDQKVEDVPVALTALPDGLWFDPDGEILLSYNQPSGPAKVAKFATSGASLGETEVKLASGGYLTTVQGVTFDTAGKPIVAGYGFNASNQRIMGLFTFEK